MSVDKKEQVGDEMLQVDLPKVALQELLVTLDSGDSAIADSGIAAFLQLWVGIKNKN